MARVLCRDGFVPNACRPFQHRRGPHGPPQRISRGVVGVALVVVVVVVGLHGCGAGVSHDCSTGQVVQFGRDLRKEEVEKEGRKEEGRWNEGMKE